MNTSLSKALKIKNRIVKEINDLQSIISNNNSSVSGNVLSFDIRESYKELNELRSTLGELKIKINTANSGMVDKMVELSELKAHITFLKTIDTKEGKVSASRYDGAMIDKVAVFKANEIREKVKNTQKKINLIQDEIDTYNASTMIDFIYEG